MLNSHSHNMGTWPDSGIKYAVPLIKVECPLFLQHAFALGALARQLAGAADRLGGFAGAPLGRFLVRAAHFHLAEYALALHLLLERAQGLIDIVVSNDDLDQMSPHGFGVRLIA